MNPDAQKITDLLKQTTVSYPTWKKRVDQGYYKDVTLTKWWQAFDALSRIPSAVEFNPRTAWQRYPWNSVTSGKPLDSNSATLISTWNSRGNIHNPNVTTHAFSQAWTKGHSYDPLHTIDVTIYGIKTIRDIPYPASTQPSGDSDAHLVVFDLVRNREIDFWKFDGAALTAGSGDVFSPLGSDPPAGQGSNAAGFPALALAIWPEEIQEGVINHCLGFSTLAAAPSHRFPATKHDGTGDSQDLEEGMWLALPTSATFNSGWANWVKIIWRCLIDHGMFLMDQGGSLGIAGINPINGGLDWNDVGMGTGGSILFPGDFPWTEMRVLQAP